MKLVNFQVDEKLLPSGLVRAEYDRIGLGLCHKIYYFSVWSRSGQKIMGQYRISVPKILPRRTLDQRSYNPTAICIG